MKWFKHDTDANMDEALQEILLDYGLEGYGLYWYCLELIAGKVSQENISFELKHDSRIIARNTGSSQKKVEQMMLKFVELGLFESNNGFITCYKLAKRLDKSMTSNKEMRVIIEQLRTANPDQVMINHDEVMTESEKIMQEEKRREEIRKEKIKQEEKKPAPRRKTNYPMNEIDWTLVPEMTEEHKGILMDNRKNKKKTNSTRAIKPVLNQIRMSLDAGVNLESIFDTIAAKGWADYEHGWNLTGQQNQPANDEVPHLGFY